MAETVTIQGYATAYPDESKFIKAATRREWEAYPTLKGYITTAPDASKYVKADTLREWEAYPTIKGYVTAVSDESEFVKGNTLRVVGGYIEEVSAVYNFEQLQGQMVRYPFEGLLSSLDSENTYIAEITVLSPEPEPIPVPNNPEPLITGGEYDSYIDPYNPAIKYGHTLYLDKNWDINVNDAGNIATTKGAYAVAQNAANAIRLFTNDAYFNATQGIPHFDIELGKRPDVSESMLVNRIKKAVMSISGTTGCEPVLEYDDDGRLVSGNVVITLDGGTTVSVQL
nr:MAG TPA: Protein of unknown function (DUF2634) [Caudoviricetes sp.]